EVAEQHAPIEAALAELLLAGRFLPVFDCDRVIQTKAILALRLVQLNTHNESSCRLYARTEYAHHRANPHVHRASTQGDERWVKGSATWMMLRLESSAQGRARPQLSDGCACASRCCCRCR